jgi:PAS domain-containing protein
MTSNLLALSGFDRQLLQSTSGREIAGHDWAQTPLGLREAWPQALVTLVSTILACPAPMCVTWGPALTVFFNDAYRAILGDRAGRVMGSSYADLWAEIWEETQPLVDATLAGESCLMVDKHLVFQRDAGPDDSWWSFTYSPVRDDGGNIAGLMCITIETTARVVTERKRIEAAERLRVALSAGDPIGAWDWDVAKNRVIADSRFALIYNVDPERAAKGTAIEDFLDCIHPDDLPHVRTQIHAAVNQGVAFVSEYRILAPNDEVLWVSAQGRPVLDETGRCLRLPGLSFDITANKRAEMVMRAKAAQA